MNRTQFVINDIAVIHVEDMGEEVFDENQIYPACLPTSGPVQNGTKATHSGWSNPPPREYLQNFASEFNSENVYRDFLKQWHYRMNTSACLDPIFSKLTGIRLRDPSNTFYPPGVICAKEYKMDFCPTSGESGSPLMVEDEDRQRYTVEGIMSFIKGCSRFIMSKDYQKENIKFKRFEER